MEDVLQLLPAEQPALVPKLVVADPIGKRMILPGQIE